MLTITATSESGIATLTVGAAPDYGQGPLRTGSILIAHYGPTAGWPAGFDPKHSIELDDCNDYLPNTQTRPDCVFVLKVSH